MKGEEIVESKTFLVYRGESFVFSIARGSFDKFVKLFPKKRLNWVEQKLGDFIQRRMKKVTEEIVEGRDFENDGSNFLVWCLSDIKETYKDKYGEDLNKYNKGEKNE